MSTLNEPYEVTALRADLRTAHSDLTALRARLAEVEKQRDLHELKARGWLARLDKAERERDGYKNCYEDEIMRRSELERERDEARAQLEWLTQTDDVAKLKTDLAAARADTARLDWLSKRTSVRWDDMTAVHVVSPCFAPVVTTLRAAIDAARAGGAGK